MSDKTPAQKDGQAAAPAVRPVETFIQYLNRRAEEDSANLTFEVAASQLDQILTAETLEAMWDADDFESTGGRDLVDVEQQVNGFTVHKSDKYTSGIPAGDGKYFFVMVRSQKLADGLEFVWNTGAALLIGKLRWLEAMSLLGTPQAQCVIKGTESGEGTVLKLKPVPKRAATASAS